VKEINMGEYLIMFGLFWMAVNSLSALRIGLQHEKHVDLLKDLMKEKYYEEFEKRRSAWQWRKAVHAHSMLLSLITVIMGMLVPMMTGSSSLFINIMGGFLICAPILWTIFGTWFFKPLLGLGDIFFATGIMMGCLAFLKQLF